MKGSLQIESHFSSSKLANYWVVLFIEEFVRLFIEEFVRIVHLMPAIKSPHYEFRDLNSAVLNLNTSTDVQKRCHSPMGSEKLLRHHSALFPPMPAARKPSAARRTGEMDFWTLFCPTTPTPPRQPTGVDPSRTATHPGAPRETPMELHVWSVTEAVGRGIVHTPKQPSMEGASPSTTAITPSPPWMLCTGPCMRKVTETRETALRNFRCYSDPRRVECFLDIKTAAQLRGICRMRYQENKGEGPRSRTMTQLWRARKAGAGP
jgi:hypothetical protein